MGNTTHMWRWNGSAWALANQVYYYNGSAWNSATWIWRWDGSAWVMCYSTPGMTIPATFTGSNSGAADSGAVTTPAIPVTLSGHGSGSYSYAWTYINGASLSISNASSPNPTWSYSDVPNGTPIGGAWGVTITDNVTGATSFTDTTIILYWTNTETPLSVAGANGSGSYTSAGGGLSTTVSTGENGPNGGCAPSGGSGSYVAYQWNYYSGDTGISCSNGSIQNPTWSKYMTVGDDSTTSTSAVWNVTVQDSQGHVAVGYATISLSLTSSLAPLSFTSAQNFAGTASVDEGESGVGCDDVQTESGGVTVSGGSGNYTYNWSYVSGNGSFNIVSGANTGVPIFQIYLCVSGTNDTEADAVWQVTVSDDAGSTPISTQLSLQCILSPSF